MQQAINAALTAYIAAARNFSDGSAFSEVFAAMYAEDADTIEAALQEYNTTNDLEALKTVIGDLDDDGGDELHAYLLKYGFTVAYEALKL